MQRNFYRVLILVSLMLWGVSSAVAQSSGGYQIVFSSNRDTGDNWQLYTMNADGSGVARITQSTTNDYGAALSPDKTQIVYTQRNPLGYSEIHIMDATGANNRLLVVGRNPTWSPDGERIAYVADNDNNVDIYLMTATGFNNQQLTTHEAHDYAPAWSPDGTRIAFKSNRDGEAALYTVKLDRSELQRHTPIDDNTHPPTWSPDGTHLAFTRDVDDKQSIHTLDLTTNETRRLSPENAHDFLPIWLPAGDGFLFVSVVEGQPDIYQMNADGSNRIALTRTPDWEWWPTIFTPPES